MRLPIRPLSGRWPAFLEKNLSRFFWRDPSVILDPAVTPEEFRRAMSAIHVGDTIKITEGDRHPEADALIIDNVALADAVIVDIGASDGSTSVDLIRKLPAFGQYIIADLYFHLTARRSGGRTFLYDHDGACILVVGPRAVAWPSLSGFVRTVYGRRIARAARADVPVEQVLLLNPEARALMAADPRVSFREHDVFTRWGDPAPTVIKVANLLRRLYFPDDTLRAGVAAVLGSLDEGGYFLIVDNSRIKDMPPRAGLYRRTGDRFTLVEQTANRPEIGDLIESVVLDGASTLPG
ncbi:MAG: hypothetical protein ABWX82_06920 [Leifsonia sp.]